MPIMRSEFDAVSFQVEITTDGSAAEIRFRTEHSHEAIVTMSRQLLEQLSARLALLLKREVPPSAPR